MLFRPWRGHNKYPISALRFPKLKWRMWLLYLFFLFLSVTYCLFSCPCCLPQRVTGQQLEINSLHQRRTTVDDGSALMKKELTALHEQLVNKSQELKVGGSPGLRVKTFLSIPFGCSHGRSSCRRGRGLFSALEYNLCVFVPSPQAFYPRSVSPFLAFSFLLCNW